MAKNVRVSVDEILDAVLNSEDDYSEKDSSEIESSEEEEPCERQSLLFPNSDVNICREITSDPPVGHFLPQTCVFFINIVALSL